MGADAYIQVSPENIWLGSSKIRLWLGHSRTFTELSISHSCCVLRVIVLLEGEPSARFEVLNALDWVFITAISIVWCIGLFFYSDESLSPCHWTTAPQYEAATSTLYFWDGTLQVMSSAWFPSNMMLRIDLQTWCLVHHTRESCFSESEGPSGACLQIPSLFSMCLHWGEDWVWPHRHKAQIGGVMQWCLSFCRFLTSAYMIMLN